jgi:hypothetical protein
MFKNFVKNLWKKIQPKKAKTLKVFLAARAAPRTKEFCLWGITPKPKIKILYKLVHLEASTKPHVHQKFEIFWTNIASTMTCPNFKKA